MFEFMFASMVTILPDYLFRRYVQGKRIGKEITLFSVWHVLRYGITGCAMLTVLLITMIFYFHPSTTSAMSFFRTVTILPETPGRVVSVNVANLQEVKAGDVLFTLDDARQKSALSSAEARVKEVESTMELVKAQLHAAQAQSQSTKATLDQAKNELQRNLDLQTRNANVVSGQEIDRQTARVAALESSYEAAQANEDSIEAQLSDQLPAQLDTARAAVEQAQVELSFTQVRAGTDGTLQQFNLQPGDYINPILRPAGLIVPAHSGTDRIQAGFGQLAAQVVKPGMIAEVSCMSLPFTVIPMVIVDVQDVIAAGQFRPTDNLVDATLIPQAPGSITAIMEPLYAGALDRLPPGSRCVANAYTSYYDLLDSGEVTGIRALGLHVVDTVGLVHAAILRAQAVLAPVRLLVLSGGH
ncbi:HlyD family secretion protein [Chachezhania sediminis]|uniref:HlyD family secretion protein n=1 Tax=Chachezhania sediminis TaxID=2599291 RepID=UPI00131E6140|nr:HlyD family secretion protein [Chachezhania sediminis]